jgi:hypothetical protein
MNKKKLDFKFVKHAHRRAFYDSMRGLGKKRYAMSHVYWYMYLRSGKGNMFELAEELMQGDLDMDHATLAGVQRELIKVGWLVKHRPRDTKTGRMGVITWEIRIVPLELKAPVAPQVPLPQVGVPEVVQPQVVITTLL